MCREPLSESASYDNAILQCFPSLASSIYHKEDTYIVQELLSSYTYMYNDFLLLMIALFIILSQVLVFNCDEGIDVKSMGRIFIGLVKCGAWGCFDEFNRLEEAVLSAVSMQIQTIQAALRVKAAQCELLDRQVRVIMYFHLREHCI